MAPITLVSRQSTTTSSTSNTCSGSLSGGAIAGIVIGTIAGTLLILWLIKSCFLPGAPGNPDPDGAASAPVVYSSTQSRRRRRRTSLRDGPDYVEYIEKPPARVSRSRTRRASVVSQVSRPERIYIA